MRLEKMEERPASAAMSEGLVRPLGEVSSGVLSLLVIDDDPEFCRLAKRCLDDFAEVEFRFGVPKAGQLEVEDYDVILLDLFGTELKSSKRFALCPPTFL